MISVFELIPIGVASAEARTERLAAWAQRWYEDSCRELTLWRSVGGQVATACRTLAPMIGF